MQIENALTDEERLDVLRTFSYGFVLHGMGRFIAARVLGLYAQSVVNDCADRVRGEVTP